jgi:hypothetical protein
MDETTITFEISFGKSKHTLHLHADCLDAYRRSLAMVHTGWFKGRGRIDRDAHEFACPLCNVIGNTILPCMQYKTRESAVAATAAAAAV